jgi:hypothetical protein
MTRTFYLLLGAGLMALIAVAPEPATAQGEYKASPVDQPGKNPPDPNHPLKAKPPLDHGLAQSHCYLQCSPGWWCACTYGPGNQFSCGCRRRTRAKRTDGQLTRVRPVGPKSPSPRGPMFVAPRNPPPPAGARRR